MRLTDIDALIEDAFAGRELTASEVQAIAEHVAAAGFDPLARRRVGGQLAGGRWQGRMLQASDQLPTADRHYLKHVVLQHEWPVGTTLERYQWYGIAVARNSRSGVFISQRRGRELIGVIGRFSAENAGAGAPDPTPTWTLVEFSRETQHWSTLFRPEEGLGYILNDPLREGFRWLRRPR